MGGRHLLQLLTPPEKKLFYRYKYKKITIQEIVSLTDLLCANLNCKQRPPYTPTLGLVYNNNWIPVTLSDNRERTYKIFKTEN